MKKDITQLQIKELIKRIIKNNYNEINELRNRMTPDSETQEFYQEDYFKLDVVLDLYDLLNLLLNGGNKEDIKEKFLEIAEFYYWDFDLNDFADNPEQQEDASFYTWELDNELKHKNNIKELYNSGDLAVFEYIKNNNIAFEKIDKLIELSDLYGWDNSFPEKIEEEYSDLKKELFRFLNIEL